MSEQKPYSKAIILLLKKTVEKGSPVWEDIINYQVEIQDYLAVIGLELILKKDEGFAFVKQIVFDDDTTLNLVSRRQLGFEVSIVVIVLRQLLEDYDNNPIETQSTDRIITTNEIKDEVRLFLPQDFNRVKLEKELDTYIQRVVDLGFLKEVKRNGDEVRYKIHRIIKEKVTLEDLDTFKNKLKEYAGTVRFVYNQCRDCRLSVELYGSL